MRGSDRAVILGFAIAALAAAFWFLVLSPKRGEVSKLDEEIAALSASVDEQERLATAAEGARHEYDTHYRHLVVLGKAVPEDEDTGSLFVELDEIAERSGVDFAAIRLDEAAESTAAAAPTAGAEGATGAAPEDSEDASAAADAASAPASAPATEASAAQLPIGAAVGPAGLPVMPYQLELGGDFFELADFLRGLDELVRSRDGRPVVNGRLVTVDGFALAADEGKGFPSLNAELEITTFITPPEQGATAGATATGPSLAAADMQPVAEATTSMAP